MTKIIKKVNISYHFTLNTRLNNIFKNPDIEESPILLHRNLVGFGGFNDYSKKGPP